jgi:predicted small lipoprotein YifL
MNSLKIIRRLIALLRLVAVALCGLMGVFLLPAPALSIAQGFVGVEPKKEVTEHSGFARRIATSGFV